MPSRPITPRYRPLAWLLSIFLLVTTATRLVLLVAAGSGVPASIGNWLVVFIVGLGYDLLTFVYFAWPLVLLLWVLPRRWFTARAGRWSNGTATSCLSAGISRAWPATPQALNCMTGWGSEFPVPRPSICR